MKAPCLNEIAGTGPMGAKIVEASLPFVDVFFVEVR
jgi:hypothetical protein